MIKRLFDIKCSFLGLIILSPLFLLIAIIIVIDSKGGIFFRQKRVGKYEKLFILYKFRTMVRDAEAKGPLTLSHRDGRITKPGRFLRKYKLDELPQLINVLTGNMSMVGPRPEVPKYVALYNEEQKKVFRVKPGITDYASIAFAGENELLAKSADPETTYTEKIMPAKLKLALKYIEDQSLLTDLRIIGKTLLKILR